MAKRSLVLVSLLGACTAKEAAEPGPRPSASASIPLAAARAAPTPAAARFAVGSEVLEVRLLPDRGTITSSEPLYATLVLSAPRGALEVESAWMGRNALGRPENYRVVWVDATGAKVPVPDVGISFGGMSSEVVVEPGKDSKRRLLLQLWATSLSPGRYIVRCETTVPARVASSDGGPLTPVDIAAEAEVEVVPDDDQALDLMVAALGKQAMTGPPDEQEEAMRALATVHHPRAIAPWLTIAREPQYGHVMAAARELARWDDDRALAELVRISRTRAEDLPTGGYATEALRVQAAGALRKQAAYSLSGSPHVGALPALLAMSSDAAWDVRITVLHRVAALPDERALPLLRAFAKDPEPFVRDEARRYLARSAKPR